MSAKLRPWKESFRLKWNTTRLLKKIGLSPSFSDFIKQKVREKLNKIHRPAGICQYASKVFNNDVLIASAALFERSARYVLGLEKNVFNAEKRMSEICKETKNTRYRTRLDQKTLSLAFHCDVRVSITRRTSRRSIFINNSFDNSKQQMRSLP